MDVVIIKVEIIEIEKIDYIINTKARQIADFKFNETTIDFLKILYKKYEELLKERTNTIEDLSLYESLLDMIEIRYDKVDKLSQDIRNTIRNMKNKVFLELDIEAIDNDLLYVSFIINKYNN